MFGKLIKVPYLHYLINSHIDYPIRNEFLSNIISPINHVKSILVKRPKVFKSFYGHEHRILIAKDGEIIFCGCHLRPQFDFSMQGTRKDTRKDTCKEP